MSSARKSVVSTDLRANTTLSLAPNLLYADTDAEIDSGVNMNTDKNSHISKNTIERNMVYQFNIRSKNVRDNIIATFLTNFKDDKHIRDIEAHFMAFDSKVLDEFSEFVIYIRMYGTKIRFTTSRMEYSGMEYSLTSWDSKPAKQFEKRKKFLGIF